MSVDLETLAYEASLRALDEQERLVEALRARTGLVLATSSLAVSILGRRALEGPGPAALGALSIVCFVLSVGPAIFVLLPNQSVAFSTRGINLFKALFEFRDTPAELLLNATDVLDRLWERNEDAIRRLTRAFSIAMFALAVEILSLAALLGSTVI